MSIMQDLERQRVSAEAKKNIAASQLEVANKELSRVAGRQVEQGREDAREAERNAADAAKQK